MISFSNNNETTPHEFDYVELDNLFERFPQEVFKMGFFSNLMLKFSKRPTELDYLLHDFKFFKKKATVGGTFYGLDFDFHCEELLPPVEITCRLWKELPENNGFEIEVACHSLRRLLFPVTSNDDIFKKGIETLNNQLSKKFGSPFVVECVFHGNSYGNLYMIGKFVIESLESEKSKESKKSSKAKKEETTVE